jgi:hypothetical protein
VPACRSRSRIHQLLPPRVARLEVDGHEPEERRDAEAEVDETLTLPGLRAWAIDLEHEQTGSKVGPTLGEGVQARSEDDVLPHAQSSLLRNEVFDETRAGDNGGAKRSREWAHVRTALPSLVRSHQAQADFIHEHVRRGIDLHVHCSPQGDPYRRVLWLRYLLIIHRAIAPAK